MRTRKRLRGKGTRQAIRNQHLKDFLEKHRRETGRGSLRRSDVAEYDRQQVLERHRRQQRALEREAPHGSSPTPAETGGGSLPPGPPVGELP